MNSVSSRENGHEYLNLRVVSEVRIEGKKEEMLKGKTKCNCNLIAWVMRT